MNSPEVSDLAIELKQQYRITDVWAAAGDLAKR